MFSGRFCGFETIVWFQYPLIYGRRKRHNRPMTTRGFPFSTIGSLGLRMPLKVLAGLFAVLFVLMSVASAQAETRTLRMYYTHTKESITVTYKKNGRYVKRGLRKLNRFLRDFRRNEPTRMDPELFDAVWEIYRASGSRKPIHVISGYRSPKTNKMLRRRGRKVARNSQHTRGKALDFFLPDVPVTKLRALGLKAHVGGVGYYRGSFVHIDTGRVRHWPRMSRRQLSKVFPRGRTLHVPRDGRKMKGYKIAAANLRAGKNYDGSRRLTSAKPSLLARIFRQSGDDGDEGEGNVRAASLKASPPKKKKPAPKKVVAKKAPAKKAPPKAKGKDPFAVEVAQVSKKRKQEAAEAELAAKAAAALAAKEKANAAAAAAERLASVTVPKLRPRVDVPQVAPEEQIEVAERTQLALATQKVEIPQPRPAVDIATRTGNTVRQPDAQELDDLKSRIQTALARQRQLSAAERATESQANAELAGKIAKLAVPTSKAIKPAAEKPVVQASLKPTPSPRTTPSQRPADEPAALVKVPTPKKKAPVVKRAAMRVASAPSMVGELQLGNLHGENVKEWAIATSTRVGKMAELHAPVYDQGTRRLMPGSVYSAGFANGRPPLRADRFSGKALTRVAFARVALN